MAVTRYDQRKDYEEAEANAIGTEYVRADLLPTQDAALVRELLKKYLDQRILFYTTREQHTLAKVNTDTADLPEPTVVRDPVCGLNPTHAHHGLDLDDRHRYLLQFVAWLQRAPYRAPPVPRSARRGGSFLPSHLRY